MLLSILAVAMASVVVVEASPEGVVDTFIEDSPQNSWLEDTPTPKHLLLAQEVRRSGEVQTAPDCVVGVLGGEALNMELLSVQDAPLQDAVADAATEVAKGKEFLTLEKEKVTSRASSCRFSIRGSALAESSSPLNPFRKMAGCNADRQGREHWQRFRQSRGCSCRARDTAHTEKPVGLGGRAATGHSRDGFTADVSCCPGPRSHNQKREAAESTREVKGDGREARGIQKTVRREEHMPTAVYQREALSRTLLRGRQTEHLSQSRAKTMFPPPHLCRV